MQAIILAGGQGKRLQSVVSDVPKPLATVGDRPFLSWLLEYMRGQGVTESMLCIHKDHDLIRQHYGERFGTMALRYLVESEPMGTGGALRQAILALNPKAPVLALNGDSLVKLDYRRMIDTHIHSRRRMTLAAHRVADCSRYGQLVIRQNKVTRFDPQGQKDSGYISAGFYVVSPDLFDGMSMPKSFSLEHDFLAPHASSLQPAAYTDVQYFIDIGVPIDYLRAQAEIPQLLEELHEA